MYTISDISILIGAHRIGTYDQQIDWLLTDSRSLCFPESTLFFAIRTGKGDGHAYIRDLYERGVRAFVVEEVPEGEFPQANFFYLFSFPRRRTIPFYPNFYSTTIEPTYFF